MFENCQTQPHAESCDDDMAHGSPCRLEIVLDSVLAKKDAALAGIVELVRCYRANDHDLFAIRVALEEAIVNAILHGNHSNPEKSVRLVCELTSRQIFVRIEDEGLGFAPEAIPDPTLPQFLTRPHGRGLYLMRHYMTSVAFHNGGRVVEMTRQLEGK